MSHPVYHLKFLYLYLDRAQPKTDWFRSRGTAVMGFALERNGSNNDTIETDGCESRANFGPCPCAYARASHIKLAFCRFLRVWGGKYVSNTIHKYCILARANSFAKNVSSSLVGGIHPDSTSLSGGVWIYCPKLEVFLK